jgi:hypothetical protein
MKISSLGVTVTTPKIFTATVSVDPARVGEFSQILNFLSLSSPILPGSYVTLTTAVGLNLAALQANTAGGDSLKGASTATTASLNTVLNDGASFFLARNALNRVRDSHQEQSIGILYHYLYLRLKQ